MFQLGRPGRLRVSVYGPGPSCARLGTFSRRGHPGVNRVPFSGTLFGRPLAPGRYAIVVEAVRGSQRVRIGRVLVVILPRDGREGGSRALPAPDCNGSGGDRAFVFLTGGGDFGSLSALAASSDGEDRAAGSDGAARGDGGAGEAGTGGVAGVSAGRGEGDETPLLPNLPALPALPTVVGEEPLDVPLWAFVALGIGGALGAAALIGFGIRRHRENYGGWD